VVKEKASLGDVRDQAMWACRSADERNVGATSQDTDWTPLSAS